MDAAAVAAEGAAGAQHAVARDDDRDRVGAERVARGPRRARVSGLGRDPGVARYPAVGNRGGDAEDLARERPAQRPVEVELEQVSRAREVLVELAPDRVERRPRLHDPRRDAPGEALQDLVHILLREGEAYEAAPAGRDQQRAERRVGLRVADVGEAVRGRALGNPPRGQRGRSGVDCRAAAQHAGQLRRAVMVRRAHARTAFLEVRRAHAGTAFLEVRRAHAGTAFLNLDRPSCSERRAASSEQPIAVAISRWGRSAT